MTRQKLITLTCLFVLLPLCEAVPAQELADLFADNPSQPLWILDRQPAGVRSSLEAGASQSTVTDILTLSAESAAAASASIAGNRLHPLWDLSAERGIRPPVLTASMATGSRHPLEILTEGSPNALGRSTSSGTRDCWDLGGISKSRIPVLAASTSGIRRLEILSVEPSESRGRVFREMPAAPCWDLASGSMRKLPVLAAATAYADAPRLEILTPEPETTAMFREMPAAPRWDLNSEAAMRIPSLSASASRAGLRSLEILAEEPAVETSAVFGELPALPRWELRASRVKAAPVVTAAAPAAAANELEIRTDRPAPARLQVFSTDESNLLSTINLQGAGSGPDSDQDPAEAGEGELAIPMVEPLELRGIRIAALQNNNQISVIRFQQEELASDIDIAAAAFDPYFGAALYGGEAYRQNQSIIQSFGANTVVQDSFFLRPYGENQFFLRKRNLAGGQTTIGFTTDYLSLDPANSNVFFNPGWDSRLRFQYQQSLLRGYGEKVNRAPIYIAQRRADQSAFVFQAGVQQLLRDVELAYWDWELAYALQELLEQDEERSRGIWDRESESLKIGTGTVVAEAQAYERYHQARLRLIQGVSLATIAELNLRRIAGLPPAQGFAFVPADSATDLREYADLGLAICTSIHRPEVLAQQAAVAAANAQTVIAENGLKPDLSLILDYSALGLQERFDNSLSTLGEFRYYEWTVGVRYAQPLYWRAEKAGLRKAQWFVARQQALLDQVNLTISHEVATAYQQVRVAEAQLEVHRERIESADREVEARAELYRNRRGTLNFVIDAQDRLLAARTDYRVALTNYQKAVSSLKFASGMILDDQVIINDQSSPQTDNPAPPQNPGQGVDSVPANPSN